jgi:hypothetical protein
MNWKLAKEYFEDDGMLVDVYYEHMTTSGWEKLFGWLSANSNVTSINCYIPESDENSEKFPKDINAYIDVSEFYCFVSMLVGDITLFLRFYEKSELECDVSPSEIDSEEKLFALLSILEEIKVVTGSSRYLVCPENSKEGVFIVNGELVA